jgi:hypothetical protein
MLRGVRGGRGRGGRGGLGSGTGNLTCQLAVRNIPPTFNTIAHLNNHFARFGSLINVQVHFEGDPASALVSCLSVTWRNRQGTEPDLVIIDPKDFPVLNVLYESTGKT